MPECPYCEIDEFECPWCKGKIPFNDIIDIFHVGRCPFCKVVRDEPCPARTDENHPKFNL